jgi:hypothetical protein
LGVVISGGVGTAEFLLEPSNSDLSVSLIWLGGKVPNGVGVHSSVVLLSPPSLDLPQGSHVRIEHCLADCLRWNPWVKLFHRQ